MHRLLHFLEYIRIRAKNRFVPFVTTYPGFKCSVIDKSSFLFMYEEIFEKEIYKFETDSNKPYILDCGANIGLATIYFKKLFPAAEVIAFEPDPKIFRVLKENIKFAGLMDVTAVEACLAKEAGEVTFYPDDSDGGSASHNFDSEAIKVPAITLHDYLTKQVQFLKMDIEGAEYEVLDSVKDKLGNVENIFVEYHSYHDSEQKFGEILKILKEAGFRYYIEHIGIRSKEPYLKIETAHNMDLQINIYGYRK